MPCVLASPRVKSVSLHTIPLPASGLPDQQYGDAISWSVTHPRFLVERKILDWIKPLPEGENHLLCPDVSVKQRLATRAMTTICRKRSSTAISWEATTPAKKPVSAIKMPRRRTAAPTADDQGDVWHSADGADLASPYSHGGFSRQARALSVFTVGRSRRRRRACSREGKRWPALARTWWAVGCAAAAGAICDWPAVRCTSRRKGVHTTGPVMVYAARPANISAIIIRAFWCTHEVAPAAHCVGYGALQKGVQRRRPCRMAQVVDLASVNILSAPRHGGGVAISDRSRFTSRPGRWPGNRQQPGGRWRRNRRFMPLLAPPVYMLRRASRR